MTIEARAGGGSWETPHDRRSRLAAEKWRQHLANRDRWEHREVTPAEKARMSRFALWLSDFYASKEVYDRTLEAETKLGRQEIIDYVVGNYPWTGQPHPRPRLLKKGREEVALRNPAIPHIDDPEDEWIGIDEPSDLVYDKEYNTYWYV